MSRGSDLDPIIFGVGAGIIIGAVLIAGHALWEKLTKKERQDEPHR